MTGTHIYYNLHNYNFLLVFLFEKNIWFLPFTSIVPKDFNLEPCGRLGQDPQYQGAGATEGLAGIGDDDMWQISAYYNSRYRWYLSIFRYRYRRYRYRMIMNDLDIEWSIYLSNYLSIFLSIYLSIYLSIFLSIDLSIYRSIHRSIDPSIYLSIDLSIDRSIHRSIYLSIYLIYLISLSI